MKITTLLALCSATIALQSGTATAQDGTAQILAARHEIPAWRAIPARNVVYVELATLIAFGSISVNYERQIAQNFSLRGGIGLSWQGLSYGPDRQNGLSGLAMANLLAPFAGNEQKVEIGAGACAGPALIGSTIAPALALGYRNQPLRGGLMFRLGATWVYGNGLPVQISLGYAF